MNSNRNKSRIADPYDLAALEKTLADTVFAGRLHHAAVTESTNALALAAANRDEKNGVYFADEQTAGRGRGGHDWHSSAGDGVYVSLLMRPQLLAERAMLLSLAAGLAAQTAIKEATGFTIDIRWPNDLMLGRKKCGGILVETAVESANMLRYAVIGIGINVNHAAMPAELGPIATSLRLESGRAWQRQELLAALVREVAHEIQALQASKDTTDLLRRFTLASSWVIGKQVQVPEGGGYTGITAGMNSLGLLQVKTSGGMRTVLTGGVREI
jgi:BirA family biotin operon repressor/biotin-[acetyl-CoA-carboxylase] ligase